MDSRAPDLLITLPDWQVGFTAYTVAKLLDGLAVAMLPYYLDHALPPLYSGHVRFATDAAHGSGTEVFADPWTVAQRGFADCNELVWYRLVELLAHGERAATTRVDWDDPEIHVAIRRWRGRNSWIEDPSRKLLGMEFG